MKTIFRFALAALIGLLALNAKAATLKIPSQQNTGRFNNRALTLTPLMGPRFVGQVLTHSDAISLSPAQWSNGVYVVAGPWRITFDGLSGYQDIVVPETNGVVWASDCVPYFPTAVNLNQFYTRSQVDSLLAQALNGSNIISVGSLTLSPGDPNYPSDFPFPVVITNNAARSSIEFHMLGVNGPLILQLGLDGMLSVPALFINDPAFRGGSNSFCTAQNGLLLPQQFVAGPGITLAQDNNARTFTIGATGIANGQAGVNLTGAFLGGTPGTGIELGDFPGPSGGVFRIHVTPDYKFEILDFGGDQVLQWWDGRLRFTDQDGGVAEFDTYESRMTMNDISVFTGSADPPTVAANNGSLYLSSAAGGKWFLRVNGAWMQK